MNILGINAYHPDSSACLVVNGKIEIAIEEERINRIKHWAGFPLNSIKCCLENQNIKLNDIDYIAINQNLSSNFFNKFKFTILNKPNFSFYFEKLKNKLKKKNILTEINEKIGKLNSKCELIEVEHHLSHIASAYYISDFDKSVNLSIDGFGDFTSTTWGFSEKEKIIIDKKIIFPNSLGVFYEAFTQFLGFKNYGDEYKMMGLSSYGKSNLTNKLEKIINISRNGEFILNLDYFNHHKKNTNYSWEDSQPFSKRLFSNKIYDLLGPQREKDESISDYHLNIASSVQKIYETALFNILSHVEKKYPDIKNLTLSGGCAQNSLANGKIKNQTSFENIFIPPNPGDAGGAIGAALYVYNKNNTQKLNIFDNKNPYLGPNFDSINIKKQIDLNQKKLDLDNCKVSYYQEFDDLTKFVARKISQSKIVGWFQGNMEWGPRALGNRSILADPRNKNIKDILNTKIKKREEFRPFAPAILEEEINDWFELQNIKSPYMSNVYKFKKKVIDTMPSVVHIDGTGRVQTVNKILNSRFHKLINNFYKQTNIPILINTSFNENEPIVFTPQNAIDCFLRTKMDLLVIENYIIERLN